MSTFDVILSGDGIYGIMIMLGVVGAGLWGVCAAKRFVGMNSDNVILIMAYAVGFGMFGAKLLYILVNIRLVDWSRVTEPEYFMGWISGGFVFYGGLIGGAASLLLVHLIHRIHTVKYMEIMIPGLPFAHGMGRIGCHLAGCCYGIPHEGWPHIIYHNNLYAPNDIPLFPVQLTEACACFVLAFVLAVFVLRHMKPTPKTIYLYAYSYGILRFIIEFFRYDSTARGIYGWLSTSQWISLIIILIVTLVIIINKRFNAVPAKAAD